MLLWGQQRVTGSLCDNCDNNNTLKSTQVSTIKCPYKYQKWKYLFCRNMWLMHDSDIIRRLILVCEQHFPVAQDGAGFNFYIYSTQFSTSSANTWIRQIWHKQMWLSFEFADGKRDSSCVWTVTTQESSQHRTFLKLGSNMSASPSYFCVCVAHLEVASVLSRKKGQRSTFCSAALFEYGQAFSSAQWLFKDRAERCATSWFKAHAAPECCRKINFHKICTVISAPPSIRCLTGARSVTSCAKFIRKSSFVDPAQTIKGAAGMTSAWKIPHMERWKMTCGFLRAEASSAVWQGKRRRRGGERSLVVFLDFPLYIQ